ncbi:MAG TPA: Sir2 family NAD-dependent protein deacetylase [Chitinophagales bacterium]|nr:Sir2 family NAD-dependent protein deacetylase [Chitinophagales bacterium]
MDGLKEIITEVWKKETKNTFTFLTGAGLSADSGIPTYRGSDGIWIKGTRYHKPEEFGTFKYFIENPEEVWQHTMFRKQMFRNAAPNSSHTTIAEIESLLGDRFQLITQNIDNLHKRAGSSNVYEIHGNYREVKCSGKCKGILSFPEGVGDKNETEDLSAEEIDLLKCPRCGSWLRPNVLLFDEEYDEVTNKKFSALSAAKNTGILFVTGTSGATNLPMEIAKTTLKYGGYVIDINTEDNHFTDLIKDKKRKLIIRSKTSEALPVIRDLISGCVNDDAKVQV